MTLPLTVGPGSISIAITLGANESRHLGASVLAIFSVAVASVLIALSVYLCYSYVVPSGGRSRAQRNERGYAAFGISSGLHRRADFVERHERFVQNAKHLRMCSAPVGWRINRTCRVFNGFSARVF